MRKTLDLAAALMILVGALLFFWDRLGFSTITSSFHWSIFIIAPGLVLLVFAMMAKVGGRILAPFGMMVTLTGLLLAYQDWANHYESWAYMWVLVSPFAVGAGWIFHGFLHDDIKARQDARSLMIGSLVGLIALGVFFEGMVNISGNGMSSDVWSTVISIGLIGGGVFMIGGQKISSTLRSQSRTGQSD